MKKARDFDNILDQCLERVIKGEPIEQCLAEHPDNATELEPLLRTALTAREITSVRPRREFRERASYQFQAAIRDMESKKSRGLSGWKPQWATALIAVVVLLLAGSGTVAAAGNSMPDEPLYQVKLATEAVRISLTPSALGKAELYARLADKRVAEIINMADKGKAAEVEQTAERLNSQLEAMASLDISEGERQIAEVDATFEPAEPQIASEEAPSIEAAKPVPAPAPAAGPLRKQLKEAPAADVEEAPTEAADETPPLLASPAPAPNVAAGPGSSAGEEGEVTNLDEQARLRATLSRKAMENQEALREVLERAPESVKPALQQAIETAGVSYQEAIRNLE